MAARKNTPGLDDRWRTKIQISMLINRLEKHINGSIKLENSQIKAIEILLRKVAPDLQTIEHKGDINHKVTAVEIVRRKDDSAKV